MIASLFLGSVGFILIFIAFKDADTPGLININHHVSLSHIHLWPEVMYVNLPHINIICIPSIACTFSTHIPSLFLQTGPATIAHFVLGIAIMALHFANVSIEGNSYVQQQQTASIHILTSKSCFKTPLANHCHFPLQAWWKVVSFIFQFQNLGHSGLIKEYYVLPPPLPSPPLPSPSLPSPPLSSRWLFNLLHGTTIGMVAELLARKYN